MQHFLDYFPGPKNALGINDYEHYDKKKLIRPHNLFLILAYYWGERNCIKVYHRDQIAKIHLHLNTPVIFLNSPQKLELDSYFTSTTL